jgi:hypothetical protein
MTTCEWVLDGAFTVQLQHELSGILVATSNDTADS